METLTNKKIYLLFPKPEKVNAVSSQSWMVSYSSCSASNKTLTPKYAEAGTTGSYDAKVERKTETGKKVTVKYWEQAINQPQEPECSWVWVDSHTFCRHWLQNQKTFCTHWVQNQKTFSTRLLLDLLGHNQILEEKLKLARKVTEFNKVKF